MLSKPVIKHLRSLQLKKFREEEKLFVVEGPKMVQELLNHREWKVKAVYALHDWHFSGALPCDFFEVDERELEQISGLQTPNKVLAVVEYPSPVSPDKFQPLTGLHLLIDQVQDPGNLGTIIRIADWFGIESVICSLDTVDCFNPKVIQSTMGSLFRVKTFYSSLTDVLIRNAGASRLPVYATLLDGDNIYQTELASNGLIIMGNESRGVNPVLHPFISKGLLIPSRSKSGGNAESLNVAMAAGIVCAEFFRQSLK
jgi:RNA methyltransferase, TrmH family